MRLTNSHGQKGGNMRAAGIIAAWLMLASTAAAAIIDKIPFAQVQREAITAGVVLGPNGAVDFKHLRLTNSGGTRRYHLLTIEEPHIQRFCYAIDGEVQYRGVEGTGYFEATSHMPDGKRYVMKTLAAGRWLQRIEGDTDWRDFGLAYSVSRNKVLPERIDLDLVLPGPGTVWVGNFYIAQFGPPLEEVSFEPQRAWSRWPIFALLTAISGAVGVIRCHGSARLAVAGLTALVVGLMLLNWSLGG